MGQVTDVPEDYVLLLNALIVFVVAELTARAEDPRAVLCGGGPPDGDIVIGKTVTLSVPGQGWVAGSREYPDSVSGRMVTYEPHTVRGGVLYVVSLVRVLAPARPPALIRAAVVMEEHLIHAVAVDIEINTPIGMVMVVGIAGEPRLCSTGRISPSSERCQD